MRLAPFALERFFARHEFTARYTLGSSDCESVRIADLLALEPGATEELLALGLGYTESAGHPELRRAIAAGLYPRLASDEVLVCAGAEEALFLYFQACLEAGDHVVVHTPCYASLLEVPRSLGARVTPWLALPELGWLPDLDALPRLLEAGTKLVVVNTPHNPTGAHLPRAQFDRLVEVVSRHGARLLVDEVYRELEHADDALLPPACEAYDRATSVGVTSKTYGLPGLRIGWVATRDEAARTAMATLKDYTTICSAGPSEFLAMLAMRHRTTLRDRNRRLVRDHLALLQAFLARHPDRFGAVAPTAGPLAFPTLLGGEGDEAFAERAASEAGVLVVPGSTFERPGHLRIGFGRANFPAALACFEAFVGGHRQANDRP